MLTAQAAGKPLGEAVHVEHAQIPQAPPIDLLVGHPSVDVRRPVVAEQLLDRAADAKSVLTA